jgi:hypothetical protein
VVVRSFDTMPFGVRAGRYTAALTAVVLFLFGRRRSQPPWRWQPLGRCGPNSPRTRGPHCGTLVVPEGMSRGLASNTFGLTCAQIQLIEEMCADAQWCVTAGIETCPACDKGLCFHHACALAQAETYRALAAQLGARPAPFMSRDLNPRVVDLDHLRDRAAGGRDGRRPDRLACYDC